MTYTGSNEGYVGKKLKLYFEEAGLDVPQEIFNEVVNRVITSGDFKDLKATNGSDLILQRGLNILEEIQQDRNSNNNLYS